MSRAAVEARREVFVDERTIEERAQDACDRQIELSMSRASKLADQLYGPDPDRVPYVRDEFGDMFPPWHRVFVNVAGYALNYHDETKDNKAEFHKVAKCPKCGTNMAGFATIENLAWEKKRGYCKECEVLVETRWLRP